MPEQTFRYAACGGANTVLAILVFNFSDTVLFREQNVNIGVTVLKSYNAALLISFFISFIIGFLLLKFVVFVDSNLRGRIQLFRYLVTYLVNLALSYVLMKIFVEVAGIDKRISQLIATVIVIAISYISQKYFTFRTRKQIGG